MSNMSDLNRYKVSLVSTFIAESNEHAVEQFIDMIAESDTVPNNTQMLCLNCNHSVGAHENTTDAPCTYCSCIALHINAGTCTDECFEE